MSKNIKRILTWALALTLCLASAVPAFAIDAAEGKSTYVYFDKNLEVPAGIAVPDASFTFTLEGTNEGAQPDKDFYEVHVGPTAGVAFIGAAGTVSSTGASATVSFTSSDTIGSEGYATHWLGINFGGVGIDTKESTTAFYEPGIYRYKLTEGTGSTPGITYSTEKYYIDVYVEYAEDGEGGLQIGGIIVTKGTPPTVPENGVDDNVGEKVDAGGGDDGDEGTPDTKDDGGVSEADFTNKYTPKTLTLTKTVSGNQGSKTDEFAFEVKITGGVPDGTYTINGDVNGDSGETGATSIVVRGNNAEQGYNGTGTATVYLKNGDNVNILVPTGAAYTITESTDSSAGYTVSYKVDGASASNGNAATGSVTDNGSNKVEFINYKNGTVPTGILLTIAPFVILMLIGLFGVTVIMRKRRYN